MQNLKFLLPHQTLSCRLFSTSLPMLGRRPYLPVDENLNMRGRTKDLFPHKAMAKLLFLNRKQPSYFSRPPIGLSSIPIETVAATVVPSHISSSRRVVMLNKLFMRYIPEVLATSKSGLKLYGYDVQFSHISVTANIGLVRVYWIPKGTDADDEIEKLLNEAAAPLRRELINLRVMGLVPPIRFQKNKFLALMAEVDRRLKIADFGEDFVPTIFNEDILKRRLQLQAPLPVEVKDKLMQLEDEEPIQEEEKLTIPPMKMDVFGLNYEKIQTSILMGKKKKRIEKLALADEKTLLGDSAVTEIQFKVDTSQGQRLQKEALLKYMQKVKFERKKMLKEQAKEFQRKLLLETYLTQGGNDDQEDELYTEFVKNAFEDDFQDFSDDEMERRL